MPYVTAGTSFKLPTSYRFGTQAVASEGVPRGFWARLETPVEALQPRGSIPPPSAQSTGGLTLGNCRPTL